MLASAFVINVVKGILLFFIIFVAKRIFDSKKSLLKPEHEIHRCNQAQTCYDVIPLYLHVKCHHGEDDEHHQRNHLLQYLQLHE